MRAMIVAGVLGLVGAGVAGAQEPATKPIEAAGFVLMRGGDTVATERFERFDAAWKGALIFPTRDPELTQRWSAVTAPDGSVPLIEVTVTEKPPRPEFSPRMVTRTRIIVRDDSIAVDQMTDRGLMTRVLPSVRGARPYLNLSFAMLELGLRGAPSGTDAPITFLNVDGGQVARGTLHRNPDGSAVLRLGTTEIALDLAGSQIRAARIEAQDLRVTRTP